MANLIEALESLRPTAPSPDLASFTQLKERIINDVTRVLKSGGDMNTLQVHLGTLSYGENEQASPILQLVNQLTDGQAEKVSDWWGAGNNSDYHYYKTTVEGVFLEEVVNPPDYTVTKRYTLIGASHLA